MMTVEGRIILNKCGMSAQNQKRSKTKDLLSRDEVLVQNSLKMMSDPYMQSAVLIPSPSVLKAQGYLGSFTQGR
jgi:hypothetical protein